MTSEQRQQIFLDELTALQQRYGFQIGAQIQVEQLGPAYLSKPVVSISPIPDWQEPPILTPDEINEALHGNGRPKLEELLKP